MSTAPWDDPTPTRERPREVDIDLEPTAIVHRTEQHVQRSELDFASLCRVAQTLGPRDPKKMQLAAREVGTLLGSQLCPDGSCEGYYAWEQGGKLIEGPTVGLMEGLAEVWGRTVKSVEIVREDETSIELIGVVVDLLSLTATKRPFTSAITPPPGRFANSPEQAQRWRASQVQMATSKAIRGALEHSLPAWLTSTAVSCAKVAHAKAILGNETIGGVIPKALDHLREKWGLDESVLVALFEVPRAGWTIAHVAQLRALAEDLKAGRRTVATIREQAGGAPADPPPPSTQAPPPAASARPEQTAAPSSGGGTPPSEPPERERKVRNDVADAAALRDHLATTRGDGASVPIDVARRGLANVTRQSTVRTDRLREVLTYGVSQGYWSCPTDQVVVLAGQAPPVPPAVEVPDPWPGPLDVAVLAERVRADLAEVGTPGARQLMDAAGVPTVDGAPEPALRRLLVLTTRRLADQTPARASWEDPGVPMDPALQIELEDLVADTADAILCRAARVAGIPVGLDGPAFGRAAPDQRRQLLAVVRAS